MPDKVIKLLSRLDAIERQLREPFLKVSELRRLEAKARAIRDGLKRLQDEAASFFTSK